MLKFLSAESEPVRRYLYGVLGSALIILVTLGLVSAEEAAVYGGLAGAVLLVPAVELARSKVSPYQGRHRKPKE